MSEEQRLGRYIIEDQLGEGSFAWVYKGYDEELDRHHLHVGSKYFTLYL